MSEVKYSILLIGYSYEEYGEKIKQWLLEGKKVLWFAKKVNKLPTLFSKALKEHFMFLYELPKNLAHLKAIIIDGEMTVETEQILKQLSQSIKTFNIEQYLVEHSKSESGLVVEAGAGTGKTTVMIDRIMYLMHTVENLHFSDIVMVTFTNEATENMKSKIRMLLLRKYQFTHNPIYLFWLEQIGEFKISTIHSFFKNLLGIYGVQLGYSNKVNLRGFTYEKRKIIRDLISEYLEGKEQKVVDILGIHIYEIENLVITFWEKFINLGLTEIDNNRIDWGNCSDEKAKLINETLQYVFQNLEKRYSKVKHKSNAIEMKDIIVELHRALEQPRIENQGQKAMKYLFVDEFQDTDDLQIKIIAEITSIMNIQLFVVGDIKQSIYRFRGATDSAFSKLQKELVDIRGIKSPAHYILRKNYRTSANVLAELDKYYTNWAKRGILKYDYALEGQNNENGNFTIYRAVNQYDRKKHAVDLLQKCVEKINLKEKQKVVVLTRTNAQLVTIKEWCEKANIACKITKKGTFYRSKAVLDFQNMIAAYLYPNEPVYLYNYVLSSYCNVPFDAQALVRLEGKKDKLVNYFNSLLENTKWNEYKTKFRLLPVLSVLRELVEEINPLEIFVEKTKMEKAKMEKVKVENIEQLVIDAIQYDADLKKLMQILRDTFSAEFVSLFQIYEFLNIHIKTDFTEDEAVTNDDPNVKCVHAMTVHASKGLEFDTVIIPFTDREYRKNISTEILIEKEEIKFYAGWCYNESQSNNNYKKMIHTEQMETSKEEARLLYVATTRAIRNLYCIAYGEELQCWARLLEVKKDV